MRDIHVYGGVRRERWRHVQNICVHINVCIHVSHDYVRYDHITDRVCVCPF